MDFPKAFAVADDDGRRPALIRHDDGLFRKDIAPAGEVVLCPAETILNVGQCLH